MWMMKIEIGQRERGILHINENPTRYLRPGMYRVWRWFRNVRVERIRIDALVINLTEEQLAMVPADEVDLVEIGENQRGVLRLKGKPVRWLDTGVHQVVTADRLERRNADGERVVRPAVEVEVLDAVDIDAVPLRSSVAALAPAADYIECMVPSGYAGIRYVDGALDTVLAPGRYASWTVVRNVRYDLVETREQQLDVHGQEVMTKDRVTLRLNLSAVYRVADIDRSIKVAREPRDLVYLAVQMAARDAVSGRTLDELLADRDALGEAIRPGVAERAEAVGLELLQLGLKDMILPGEMKVLLNRVIEARKQAEASVILRREEVAATRSLAKTAEVLAENPVLLRLKELEAYKELAENVGKVDILVGGDLSKLNLLR